MAAPHIIDVEKFESQMGSLAGFRKAAKVLQALIPEWIEATEAALERRDWAGLAEQVHQMKGTGAMMCATAVSSLATTLEKHLKAGDEANLVTTTNALIRLVQATEVELRTVWLQGDRPAAC